jgi:hypothetical protein
MKSYILLHFLDFCQNEPYKLRLNFSQSIVLNHREPYCQNYLLLMGVGCVSTARHATASGSLIRIPPFLAIV